MFRVHYRSSNPLASVLRGSISGDTDARVRIGVDGMLSWGSGAAARDVRLFRSAANVLTFAGATSTGAGTLLFTEGSAIQAGTVTGLSIGTAGTQKLGFYGATPIVQPTATPAAATDLATVLTLANYLRTKALALGLTA